MKQLSLWDPSEVPIPQEESRILAFRRSCLRRQRSLFTEPQKPASPCPKDPCEEPCSSTTQSKRSRVSTQPTFVRIKTDVNDEGHAIGEGHQNAKYTDQEVETARSLYAEGYTLREVSEMMDMPIRTLRGFLDGSRRSQSVAGWRTQKRCLKAN